MSIFYSIIHFFDVIQHYLVIIFCIGVCIQQFKFLNHLHSLRNFVKEGSFHNTTILNSSIEKANSLDIQFQKFSGSINKRVKDLEIKIESLENPTTKDRIRKKIDKHYKRK